MKRNFYNAEMDILIKFNGESFVIIGDERLVSNRVIMALYNGKLVKGWDPAPVL